MEKKLILFWNFQPLDTTRVHPESYDWARKMAVDALDYEDSADGSNPSVALQEVLQDPAKLDELNLDAFADELEIQVGLRSFHSRNTCSGHVFVFASQKRLKNCLFMFIQVHFTNHFWCWFDDHVSLRLSFGKKQNLNQCPPPPLFTGAITKEKKKKIVSSRHSFFHLSVIF